MGGKGMRDIDGVTDPGATTPASPCLDVGFWYFKRPKKRSKATIGTKSTDVQIRRTMTAYPQPGYFVSTVFDWSRVKQNTINIKSVSFNDSTL